MPDEDCPICLESLNPSDELFPLPCYKCDYNFCKNCVETFERSSKDDFQEASDGSRQVKVYLACPQCRGKYPMDISEVVMLRKAHSVCRLGGLQWTTRGADALYAEGGGIRLWINRSRTVSIPLTADLPDPLFQIGQADLGQGTLGFQSALVVEALDET